MSDSNDRFRIGAWTVEPELDRITCRSGSTSLRPQVMELLVLLARHNGSLVSTEMLLSSLWSNKVVTDGTVYNTVAELRSALAAADDTRTYIETIPKRGYRLVVPVEEFTVSSRSRENVADVASSSSAVNPTQRRAVFASVAVVGLVLSAAVVVSVINGSFRESEPKDGAGPILRFTIELPQALLNFRNLYSPVTISKDSRHLVFSGEPDLGSPIYLRPLDDFHVTAVAGTENSAGFMTLSPDGNWIAFVDLTDGLLKKVPITGGIPTALCDPGGKVWGMTWGPRGHIVYESSGFAGLMQISDSGGEPRRLTVPGPGEFHKQPSFSASGNVLFFTVGERGSTIRKSDKISVLSLETDRQEDLIQGASPQSIENEFLLYYREHTLWLARFDPEILEVTSNSVPIINDIHYEDFAHYSLSGDGTLVYVADANLKRRTLVWVDRSGDTTTIPVEPRPFVMPRISPDGDRIAVVIDDTGGADLWLYSLDRGTMTRLTNDESRETSPVWSHDGSFIVYSSNRVDDLFRVSTDGTNTVEQLTSSDMYQFPRSITPDDRHILFSQGRSNTLPSDMAVLTLGSDKLPELLRKSEFKEFDPAISPDGHWLAYVSDQSGAEEIYVRPFPNIDDEVIQISVGGGLQPRWSPDGRELVYRGHSHLMSSNIITTEPEFMSGRPNPVLSLKDYPIYDMGNFDIGSDGRFLMVKQVAKEEFPVNRIVVLQNWLNDAAARIAAKTPGD